MSIQLIYENRNFHVITMIKNTEKETGEYED
jgi:hypothetical protein